MRKYEEENKENNERKKEKEDKEHRELTWSALEAYIQYLYY